jgi:hypothetical protein
VGNGSAVAHPTRWFEEFEADRFDERIERDAKADKLDKLAERARANHKAGRCEEL